MAALSRSTSLSACEVAFAVLARECDFSRSPAYVWLVSTQPWYAEDDVVVWHLGDIQGDVFFVVSDDDVCLLGLHSYPSVAVVRGGSVYCRQTIGLVFCRETEAVFNDEGMANEVTTCSAIDYNSY